MNPSMELLENVLFSIVLYHNPLGSGKMVNSYQKTSLNLIPQIYTAMDYSEFKYCPYYCEENIWHLCQNPRLPGDSKFVVVISNKDQRCAIAEQRAGRDGLVFWDYHVVLLSRRMIWDLDTLLPFPCPVGEYLKKSFSPEFGEDYLPMFRAGKRGQIFTIL